MPLNSKVRFVNIKYNDDKRIIPDVTLNLKSQKTLALLQNSGGKTVLTNFLCQPVLFCYDKLKKGDKTYFDMNKYFKTNREPSYVFLELELEDNNGYLLLGVGFKKASDGTLKKVAFMKEYSSSEDPYSIDNFPLFSIENGYKVLNGIDDLYTKFTNEKKDSQVLCFRSNNHLHKKKFKAKLLEYRINELEWKNIYTKVNATEGGMDELFENSKTSQDLLKDWIIPAIEDKLSGISDVGDDKIDDIRQSINDYISEKEAKQTEIKKLGELREYCGDIEKISTFVEQKESCDIALASAKSNLANISLELNIMSTKLNKKEEELSELIEENTAQIFDLKYKQFSLEIQDVKNNITSISKEIDNITIKYNEALKKEEHFKREELILECAELHEEMEYHLSQIERINELLKPLNVKLAELETKTNNIKYSLKVIYSKELELMNNKLDSKKLRQQECVDEQIKISKEINDSKVIIKECDSKITSFTKNINVFENEYSKFKNNNSDFVVDIDKYSRLLDKNELLAYKDSVSLNVDDLSSKIKDMINKEKENKKTILSLDNELKLSEKSVYEMENSRNSIKQKLEDYLNTKDNLLLSMREFEYTESDLFKKEYIINDIKSSIQKHKDYEHELILENERLKKTRTLYKNSKIDVDKAVKEKFEECNIDFIYGLEYLKNYNGSYESKLNLLRRNPLLPYSLIVDKSSIPTVEKIIYKQFSDNVIPIIARQDIGTVNISRNNSLLTLENINIFVGYNEDLIDEEHIKAIIEELNKNISKNVNELEHLSNQVSKLMNLENQINGFNYSKDTEIVLASEELSISKKIEETQKHIDAITEQKNAIILETDALKDNITTSKEILNEITIKLKDINLIVSIYDNYADCIIKKTDSEKIKNEKECLLDDLDTRKDYLLKEKTELESEIKSIRKDIEELSKNKHEYLSYTGTGEILKYYNGVNMDSKSLEQQLIDIRNSGEFTEVNHLNDEISNHQIKVTELETQIDATGIDSSEYINVEYSYSELQDVREKLNEANALRIELSNKLSSTKKEKDLAENDFKKKAAKCIEDFNKEYYEGEILKIDFDKAIKKENAALNENKELHRECKNVKKGVQNILNKSEIYKDYKIDDSVTLAKITEDNYDTLFDEFKDELNKANNNINKLATKIESLLRSASDKYGSKYNNQDIAKDINKLMNVNLTKKNLDIYVVNINSKITLLEGSEERLQKQFNTILMLVTAQANKLLEELKQVDKNSTLNGKKVFKIILPKEPNEVGINEFLTDIIEVCMNEPSRKDRILNSKINSYNILNSLIDLDRVRIELVKFNARGVIKDHVPYEETHSDGECSGAQRTIMAFIILQAILDYTNTNIIADNKKTHRFIFLDNPFAKVTTEDFLELFFSIADKFKMQMFCFTDISKPAVLKQFKNIAVMHIVPRGKNEYIEVEQDKSINEILESGEFSQEKNN